MSQFLEMYSSPSTPPSFSTGLSWKSMDPSLSVRLCRVYSTSNAFRDGCIFRRRFPFWVFERITGRGRRPCHEGRRNGSPDLWKSAACWRLRRILWVRAINSLHRAMIFSNIIYSALGNWPWTSRNYLGEKEINRSQLRNSNVTQAILVRYFFFDVSCMRLGVH